VGSKQETEGAMLGIPPPNVTNAISFPHGSLGTFCLNGNHEMYARGYGYFDTLLPTVGVRDPETGKNTGQLASYFSLESAYWRFIALDTGYNTFNPLGVDKEDNPQPQAVIDWLNNTVRIGDPDDKRGIVLLSHHQYFTAFSDQDPPNLDTPKQLAALIPPGRKVLWLWGHEHRFSLYGLHGVDGVGLNVYGRCVGVGGFPVQLSPVPEKARDFNLELYDDRTYDVAHGIWNAPMGFNGFSVLNVSGNALSISYRSLLLDANGKLDPTASDELVVESWAVAPNGDVTLTDLQVVNPNITIVNNVPDRDP